MIKFGRNYRLTIDPTEKDALQHTPAGQPRLPTGASALRDEFAPLELLHNLGKPPAVRYRDLEAMVTSSVRYNTLPMRVRTDFFPVTPASICTNVTLQFDRRDLQFQQKDSLARATINLYGRISTMSRRVVSVFERDRKLLEYLEGLGVRPGVTLDVLARNYDETLTLRVNGRSVQLGRPAASKIWVA